MPRPTLSSIVGAIGLALLLGAGMSQARAGERPTAVAVFPVENLSGNSIPADAVKQLLVTSLASRGGRVLDNAALEGFMTRHRIRYAAGIDGATAELLRKDTGVDGVAIATVALSSATAPPKLALILRLVSVTGAPTVVWADDVAMAGDDAPGVFGLGLINDYQALVKRALDRLGGSLLAYLDTGQGGVGPASASKFRPKVFRRDLAIQPDRTYSVAVAPFFNLSGRRDAGEILALLFMRHLSGLPQFRVVDAGVTRRQLLDARVIMDGGLSLSDAERLAGLSDADFVLGGRVIRYEDYEGAGGRTRVEFSTTLIDRKTRRVVWSSESYNDGSDGVRFFERGTSRTAHAMATQMVRLTAEMIAGRSR